MVRANNSKQALSIGDLLSFLNDFSHLEIPNFYQHPTTNYAQLYSSIAENVFLKFFTPIFSFSSVIAGSTATPQQSELRQLCMNIPAPCYFSEIVFISKLFITSFPLVSRIISFLNLNFSVSTCILHPKISRSFIPLLFIFLYFQFIFLSTFFFGTVLSTLHICFLPRKWHNYL